ncbi:MAG: helix-turn-helix domain-containing protein [Mycobacterium sp.]|nr:helix-turn-helix domain-containing protein [Mycobacterium sp.]
MRTARQRADTGLAVGVDENMVKLSRIMLARVSELGEQLADRIFSRIDGYRATPAVRDDVRQSCIDNMTFVFRSLSGEGEADLSPAVTTGRARAVEGIPLASVMTAYRIGFRLMWEQSVAAARDAGIPTESILGASAQIFLSQDEFTQAMTSAYREQLTSQIVDREEERSALVEAVLFGRITDHQSLWEAADLLGLPTGGPYVVAAAEIPAIGKLGLPEIANKLAARDIRSAWRLLPDLQVGVVHLRQGKATYGALVEVLRKVATARVGLSPAFDSLADTGDGLRLARLAVTGEPGRDGLVCAFDDAPLAFDAVSSPEVMTRIEESVLGGLRGLPAEERAILVDTFQAWLDAGGSANDAAATLFCHPNTVRHRLHRIEERTGRSLSRPRDVAELCLAFEIGRRLPG